MTYSLYTQKMPTELKPSQESSLDLMYSECEQQIKDMEVFEQVFASFFCVQTCSILLQLRGWCNAKISLSTSIFASMCNFSPPPTHPLRERNIYIWLKLFNVHYEVSVFCFIALSNHAPHSHSSYCVPSSFFIAPTELSLVYAVLQNCVHC